MANDGDIPTWAAGVAAIVGGIVAATGAMFRRGQPDRTDNVIAALVREHDRRLNAQDHRIDDMYRLLEKMDDTIGTLQADVREALTALRERRK